MNIRPSFHDQSLQSLDGAVTMDAAPGKSSRLHRLLPYALLALVFAVSLALRPVIPIDETRYLTAAWEMWLRQDFLVPTVNFTPYFQKPPLLFWLIDLSWSVFGVGRAAALVPLYAISAAVIYLTGQIATALLPRESDIADRVRLLLAGNLVFMIYSSLVLFDLLLTLCALGSVLAFLAYARDGAQRHAAVAGLLAGLGVLAKGPVVLIHIGWPVALFFLLRGAPHRRALRADLKALLVSLVCAVLPTAAWLGPLAAANGWETLRHLIWDQAAGRITGNVEDAHTRPCYFYLPLLPLFAAPWFGVGDFWKGLGSFSRSGVVESEALRFVMLWAAGVVVTFSLIAGKQPHYLVPILPPATIALACIMKGISTRRLWLTAALSLALFSVAHVAARFTLIPANDLTDVAQMMARTPGEWAVTRKYRGELNFLARLQEPLPVVEAQDAALWLSGGTSRYLIDLNGKLDEATNAVFAKPYRRTRLQIFRGPGGPSPEQ